MKLALLQPVQNGLYDFASPGRFTAPEAARLQGEMLDQTFALLGEAGPCDLIVTTEAVNFPGLPEWVEGDYAALVPPPEDPLFARFSEAARRAGSYLAAGAYTKRGGRLYNSALVFDRAGRRVALYDKVHLAGDEKKFLTPGGRFCAVDADFGRFGVCVCWDMQFPEVSRALALMGARLIVCPTWGWEQIYAHARAYENGVFVAGAMSVPHSAPIEGLRSPSELVSPDGAVLAAAPRDRAAALTCRFDLAACEARYALRMGGRRPETYGQIADYRAWEDRHD